jgi:enoyl reductase-like protein
MPWRWEHMYNLRVEEIIKKNEPSIKAVFETYHTPAKKFVTIEDIEKFISKCEITEKGQ